MKIGRPLEYDPDQALDSAMNIFWEKGYDGTSLQDLLNGMQLSKSSLYQGFKSKRHLFLLCIERYRENITAEMAGRLQKTQQGIDFISITLFNVINEISEVASPRGCLITNTATEFAQSDHEIATAVAKGVNQFKEMFLLAVQKGQQDGSVRQDISADLLADYLITNMNGLRTMVKAGTDEATLKNVVDVIVDTVR